MTDRIGVLLHGPEDLAPAVATRLARRDPDRYAVAAGPLDPTLPAVSLAGCSFAVGVAAAPWPASAERHAAARDTLHAAATPYFAVETWHRHPTWVEILAAGIEVARGRLGAPHPHVLFTAPGPADDAPPEQQVFLRETAGDVTAQLGLTRRSIAWTGGRASPTVEAALGALRQAHDQFALVHCSLDPAGADTGEVDAAAAAAGVAVVHTAVEPTALARALADVVETVVEHET